MIINIKNMTKHFAENVNQFSALGNRVETIVRLIFGAFVGVVVVIICIMAIWSLIQNGSKTDEKDRKNNNKKIFYCFLALIGLCVVWTIAEIVIASIPAPETSSNNSLRQIIEIPINYSLNNIVLG